MIKKLFVVGLVSVVSSSALACELPRGESIKIGCTYQCDFFYRMRLTMTGWGLGYSTKIVNLRNAENMREAMLDVDGILLPGGADIDPKYYLDSITPELRSYTEENMSLVNFTKEGKYRDSYEHSLVKLYSKDETFKKTPMLGICRGLQMMSVAQGIPLYLDIKTELGIKNRRNLFDRVEVTKENKTLINSIYRNPSFKGYKLHHQGIRVPYYQEHASKYPLTRVTAYSNGGKIAEAIEYTHRPALGVQYHPERSFSGTSVPVFQWFLKKACENKSASRKEVL